MTDIKGFYCPTRRTGLRAGTDTQLMLSGLWTGGGIDYGGSPAATGRSLRPRRPSTSMRRGTSRARWATRCIPLAVPARTRRPCRWVPRPSCSALSISNVGGVFGNTNQSTTFGAIRDGLSNTFLDGELQRISSMSTSG